MTLVFALLLATPPADGGELLIHMSGFRSAAGQVLIAVYRGEDGFPGSPDRAWKTAVATVTDGRASVAFAAPAGEYAVAIVHDENGNGRLDTSWLGIPKEGLGTSNNARGRLGPPKYRDAKFSVGADGAVQQIAMFYL